MAICKVFRQSSVTKSRVAAGQLLNVDCGAKILLDVSPFQRQVHARHQSISLGAFDVGFSLAIGQQKSTKAQLAYVACSALICPASARSLIGITAVTVVPLASD